MSAVFDPPLSLQLLLFALSVLCLLLLWVGLLRFKAVRFCVALGPLKIEFIGSNDQPGSAEP
jgi:hypothetical protein